MIVGTLKDKTALILGASRGIGRGIARQLGREGLNMVVSARSLTSREILRETGTEVTPTGTLEETVAEVAEAGGTAHAVACDLTDDGQV
ncbi:MAG: SDR family NAD(P)-dependent oxidoreductase, partial [Pseudomonadota bacterium]